MSQNPFKFFASVFRKEDILPLAPADAEFDARSSLGRGDLSKIRGKAPAIKWDSGKYGGLVGWRTHRASDADLEEWHADGNNVGLRLSANDLVIDNDSSNDATSALIEEATIKRLGASPLRVGGRGGMLFYRTDALLDVASIEFDEGGATEKVEVFTLGRQVALFGSHLTAKTGAYRWPRPPKAGEPLSLVTQEMFDLWVADMRALLPTARRVSASKVKERREVSQESLRVKEKHLDLLRRACAALPNTKEAFKDRDAYIEVGYAFKAAFPNEREAYEGWTDWSLRYEDGGQPEHWEKDWRGIKPMFRIGADWLFDKAAELGVFDKAALHFESQEPDEDDDTPSPAIELNLFPEQPANSPKRFSFTTLQDAAASALAAANKPLIKGLLDQGTLSVMYGPSNVGKTFAAMDMFFHIAAGLAWGGMRVSKGAVVYVAAEGGAGARKRADALCRRYGPAAAGADFNLLLSNVDLLRPDADLNPLIESILALGRPVAAVGLDTLARVMAGGEENGSVDMGTMVKHFDKIRHATGAHVMIVHHSGKDVAKGSRGHSSLRAATDTEIEISEGQLAVTKQRDLDKEYSTPFRLNVVELGRDADGDPVTSCTVELVARHVEPTSPATPKEQLVLDALNVLVSSGDSKGAKVSEIAGFLAEGKADDMSAETVRTHLKNLAKKHQVTCPGRGIWAPKAEEKASSYFVDPGAESTKSEESGRQTGVSVFE